MGLVDHQLIHAQLLKGDNIILSALVVELGQLRLDLLLGLLHLLNGKPLTLVVLHLLDAGHDLVKLVLQHSNLPLNG